jgi:hypothetical protein
MTTTDQPINADVDVLTRAADRLEATANAAHYIEGRWYMDVAGPVASLDWLGPSHDVLTATWQQAEFVSVMSPDLARDLAAIFRAWARMGSYESEFLGRIGGRETIASARRILKEGGV